MGTFKEAIEQSKKEKKEFNPEKIVKEEIEKAGGDKGSGAYGLIAEYEKLTEEEKREYQQQKRDDLKKYLLILYGNIKEVLKHYCDLKEDYFDIIALWILGTYLHDKFETFPYLFINAMKGSGKTRLLKLIKTLTHNGDLITSLREAVLFRTAKDHTLCIDEFEGVNKKENQGLRELLNACYKKGLKVKRMRRMRTQDGGDQQVVEEFEPYTPICMANIWGMEEVLGDRCLTIILEKSRNDRVMHLVEDFDTLTDIKFIKSALNEVLVQLCSYFSENTYMAMWNNYVNNRCLYTTTLNTYTTLTTLTTQEIEFFDKIWATGINGRDLELTFPLMLIAKFISDDLADKVLLLLKEQTKSKREEEMIESKDVSLFEYVSMINPLNKDDYISIKSLTYKFREYLGDEEDDDRWLNTKWLGRALRRLGLIVDKRRVANGVEVTLNIAKAQISIDHLKKSK